MRIIPAFLLVVSFVLGGCAWLSGGEADESAPAAMPQAEAAVSEDAPAAAKDTKKTQVQAKSKKQVRSEAAIRADLDKVGRKLASQASRTVMPSKASKQVKKVNNEYVATYVEIDTVNVTTEMRPGSKGQYVGVVRYQEKVFECRGKSRQAALGAQCVQTRSRRLSELIRYDGRAWQY